MSGQVPQYPDTVSGLVGFPYASFSDFVSAYTNGEIGLSLDGPAAMQLMNYGGAGRAVLFALLGWGQFVIGLAAAALAWPYLGWGGLSLILVALIASAVSRPWMGRSAVSVMAVVGLIGVVTRISWLQWLGGVWVISYFYMVGIYRLAIARFRHDLLHDEKMLARSLVPPSLATLIRRDGTHVEISVREFDRSG